MKSVVNFSLLTLGLAFWAAETLSSIGFQLVVARFDVVATLLIVLPAGISSSLLYTYADYRVWQLLGSLGILFVLLLLHFHDQEGRVQGLGLLWAILTGVPWLVGLAVGVAIRHWKRGGKVRAR